MAYPSNDNKGAKNLVDFVVHLRDAEDAFGDVVNKAKEDITELINAVQGIDDTSTSKTGVWSSEKVSTEVAASNDAAQAAHSAADAAQASANAAQARADKGVTDAATAKGVADKAASDLAAEISRAVAAERAASNAAAVAQQTADAAQQTASTAQRTADAALPLSGGTMRGDLINAYIRRLDDTGRTVIAGGTGGDAASLHGACLLLSGSEDTASWITPGCFILYAMDKAGHGWKTLVGKPDGTLTWNGKNVLTTTNGLPVSGGTMTGDILYNDSSDNTKLTISITDNGGRFKAGLRSSSNPGAYLDVDGNGHFGLCANDGTQSSNLNGYAGGVLSWCGKSIETVDSSGTGWVRYSNGIQICWGHFANSSTTGYTVTFQAAFSTDPNIQLTSTGNNDSYAYTAKIGNRSKTGFTAWQNHGVEASPSGGIYWLAVGRWK